MRRCDATETEAQLIKLLAAFSCARAAEPLIEVMMDEGRSLARRTPAAEALGPLNCTLPALEAATQKLLVDRERQRLRPVLAGQGAQLPTQSGAASTRLQRAVTECDVEATRTPPKSRLDSGQPEHDSAMAQCLQDRLCGPGPERGARAISICCRYAYGRGAPAWCGSVMRRRVRISTAVALIALLGASAAAAADPSAPENPRAARAAAAWKKLGPRALAPAMRAYCASDLPVQAAAERELRRLGLPAVEPLIRSNGDTCNGAKLAAEILCQATPLDDHALMALLPRLSPLLTARAGRPGENLWRMLGALYPPVEDPYPPISCPNRAPLTAAVLARLLTPQAAARVAPAFQSDFAQTFPSLLPALGERAAAYVPVLARWTEERGKATYAALQALAAMGPAAAPAVPALHALLVREIAEARGVHGFKQFAAIHGGTRLTPAAQAAAAIGAAARPLVGDLREALALLPDRICDWESSEDAGAILAALAALDAAWESARVPAEAAWARTASCPEPSELSVLGGTGDAARERLMAGVAAFGPAAIAFQDKLRPVLVDPHAPFALRGRAARALRRLGAPLDARDSALARLLEARLARLERITAADQRRRFARPPEAAGALSALDALDSLPRRCRRRFAADCEDRRAAAVLVRRKQSLRHLHHRSPVRPGRRRPCRDLRRLLRLRLPQDPADVLRATPRHH